MYLYNFYFPDKTSLTRDFTDFHNTNTDLIFKTVGLRYLYLIRGGGRMVGLVSRTTIKMNTIV